MLATNSLSENADIYFILVAAILQRLFVEKPDQFRTIQLTAIKW